MEYGFSVELYSSQKKLIEEASGAIENNKFAVLSSPTGTGKTLSLLCTALRFLKKPGPDDDILALLSNSKKTLVYYCSRTHSQLSQVVREFKKNSFSYSTVILGSRKAYCLYPNISQAPTVELVNSRCSDAIKDSSCEYFGGTYFSNGIQDIEDLKKEAREHRFCPYFFARDTSQDCQIVFLPYNFLFTKRMRDTIDLDLEDKIVIIDEAHNIVNTVIELNSAEITWKNLRVMTSIQKLPPVLREIIEKICNFGRTLSGEKVFEVVSFLSLAKLSKYNMLEIDDMIHDKKLAQKADFSEIFELSRFLRLLIYSDDTGRIFCDNSRIRFTPLSPEMYFQDLKKCRSVIFAGGTMEPISTLQSIFPSLKYFSYPPVATDFLPMILSETVHKKVIKLSFAQREEQLDGVIDTLIALTMPVKKGGILIFLPSKHLLQLIMAHEKIKHFRRRVSFEGGCSLESFEKDPHILFAVLGGNLSEGINFSDEMCRLLVVVGVPYPTVSLETSEREKHSPGYMLGEAMQRVNQALGRALRHTKDYAAMILFDSRYQALKKHISPWIAKELVTLCPPAAILRIHQYLSRHT